MAQGCRVQSYREQYRAQGDTPGTVRVDAVSDAGTLQCSGGRPKLRGLGLHFGKHCLSGCFSASPVTSYLVNSSLC